MPRSFDTELATLESLRHAPPSTTEAPIRKALTNKNNFIVAKAAKLAVLHEHATLAAELAAAWPRFADPSHDPQCWAKEAIAQALAHFGYQESDLFLAGMATFQRGFSDDAATALRGICALALVQCRTLNSHRVLLHLLPLFADPEVPVQVNAARATEQIGTDSALLLLRLRAELGSAGPELLGTCYAAVLHLEGPAAIPWAAKFLSAEDDPAAEAAFAIAETRTEAAAVLLIATHRRTRAPDFRDTLLAALALTRQPLALDYLLTLVAQGSTAAREAIQNSAPTPETQARLASH